MPIPAQPYSQAMTGVGTWMQPWLPLAPFSLPALGQGYELGRPMSVAAVDCLFAGGMAAPRHDGARVATAQRLTVR